MQNKNELLLRLFTFVGIVAVFMLCIRAWLFFLICLFVQTVMLIIWAIGRKKSKRYCESTEENETLVSSAAPVRPIAQQVTERVNELYPGAKWVWAEPDSTAKILNDGHAYILLNKAGGYGKACVICCDGKVEHIEMIGKILAEQDTPEDKAVVAAPVREEQPAVNYELIAYEWVESHILELNARCNEELGKGEAAFLIPGTELPVRESWPEICKELVRNGLESAECAEEGIQINLLN